MMCGRGVPVNVRDLLGPSPLAPGIGESHHAGCELQEALPRRCKRLFDGHTGRGTRRDLPNR
jgi:hypothetical protein